VIVALEHGIPGKISADNNQAVPFYIVIFPEFQQIIHDLCCFLKVLSL